MSKRRKYSAEYKREAVELTRSSEVPITQVARELGIHPNVLSRWRREIDAGGKAFKDIVTVNRRFEEKQNRPILQAQLTCHSLIA